MNHLDLFSGIGGFALAASWVWPDHQVVSFCEIDPFCRKVLNKHWPDAPICTDIKTLTIDTLVNACYNQLTQTQKEEIDMAAKLKNYDEAVKMYEVGLSIQDVANFYSVTRQAMWMVLKRRGCVFRDQKKMGKENHFYRGGKTASDRVHDITESAIRSGIIKKSLTCEKCKESPVYKDGRSGVQAHHSDYNKPLDIMWLCKNCHHEWHEHNTAKALEIELPKMRREEICSLGGKTKVSKRKGDPGLSGGIEGATDVALLTGGFP